MNPSYRLLSSFASAIVLLVFLIPVAASEAGDKPCSKAVVEGNTAFAMTLYEQLRSTEGNIFFSPYSLSTALAMTSGGARGNTEQQMAKTLHFTLNQDQLHPAFAELEAQLKTIQTKSHIQLDVANSIWPQKGYPFLFLIRENQTGSILFIGRVADPTKSGK